MKIIVKKNDEKITIKDEIYGVVNFDSTKELEDYIAFFYQYRKNHAFGFYGVFQMTKKTNHFYSIYEDYVSFLMFLQISEYPLKPTSILKKDTFYPFYYALNFCQLQLFENNINGNLLRDLYKYHMTIRMSVYHNLMTSQQANEKIIKNFRLRSHNNQIYVSHDSPVFEIMMNDLVKSINHIMFFNKNFIAYTFLNKKILEDAILYGIITWKDIASALPDTAYLEKIIDWAHVHKKNDICSMVHFLFVPDFHSLQLSSPPGEEHKVIIWNEPYKLEYRPIKFLVCSFSIDQREKGLGIVAVKKTNHDNFFIYYNHSSAAQNLLPGAPLSNHPLRDGKTL